MLRQKVIKIQNLKSGQILCANKHCFLMPGHKYTLIEQLRNYAHWQVALNQCFQLL